MSLNSQTKRFDCVIDFPNGEDRTKEILSSLLSYLKSNATEYHFIVHDGELSVETGLFEKPHIHLLYISEHKRRLFTELGILANALNFTDKQRCLISITIWTSYEDRIQYLIHKNQPLKKPYPVDNVFSSLDRDSLSLIMNRTVQTNVDFGYLLSVVKSCKSLTEIYQVLGLANSLKYKVLIKDMYLEKSKII